MSRKKSIRVVEQRSDWDCGVACLSMLLPFSYADVSATARARFPRARKYGLALYEMEETAELLGHPLTRHYRKKDYLEGKTGILGVLGPTKYLRTGGHWVVLNDGMHIVDPADSTIWSVEDYLKAIKGRPATLLTL